MNNQNSVFGGIIKRFVTLLLILFILLPTFPAISVDVGAAEADVADTGADVTSGEGIWISGMLEYSYEVKTSSDNTTNAAGSVSRSGNTLTVKATSAKEYETGGCNSTTVEAAATTTTVTVTNASSYPLKFNTLTTGGSASVAGVAQGDTIASGASFTITVTSPANGTNATEKTGTVTVSVSEETSVTITLKPSPYVSYTVNGKTVAQNGSDQTFTADAGQTISLPAITAPAGYVFKGWRIGNDLVTVSSFSANAAYDVFPVIITENIDVNAENFKVGSETYAFWEDAVAAAFGGGGTVFVKAEEVTLPDNVLDNTLPASGGSYVKPVSGGGVEYIVPSGVTLVVPKDTSTTVHTTSPEYKYTAHVTPTAFRTLTVPSGAKITVNGAVSVDSQVCAQGQNSTSWNGTPSGPHGKIVMKSNSEMTVNSGANLYCYGYINGDGNVYIKSGAKVYELFQLRCWRGGTATSDMPNNEQRVFPMNQYYVQNVEAPMTLYKGATEYVCSCVNMSSSYYATNQIEFIGSNGMFSLTGSSTDYLTKRYHANVDRLEIAVNGNMELNALNIKITGLPLIGSIDVQSKNYVLPINNMNIWVKSGTTSIASSNTYGVGFLPSSKLTIDRGATFSVNAPTYFYDASEWVGKGYGAGGVDMVAVGYSTANEATNIRTADNLKDAELDVNGTVTVSNKLYTTESGAHITSSEGTGVINFTTACATATATTYQATQSGSDISYSEITVNNAWLQNGDESYSKTVSTGTSTWKYDKPGEHWYRYLVDFKYNDTLIDRGYYCENDDTVTYDASWLEDLHAEASNGTAAVSGSNINVTGVTADSTVTLTGTPKEYIPTFVLSEEEYRHYQLYNEGTLEETTINGDKYYIVKQASSAMPVGETYAAPTDEAMGVSADNHNDIIWNMSGLSYTSGDPYRGIVPAGETAGGPVYIYGFYTGVIAHNSWNDQYYPTLIEAFEVLPQDVSATITLLADCGTFEEESGTVAYTAYAANNIKLDLNGHHAIGRIVNNGTFTLELNGGSFDYETGATAEAAAYKGMAAVVNGGNMTITDTVGGGKITADAISNASGADGSAVIRNNAGANLTVTGKDSDNLLTLKEIQTEIPIVDSKGNTSYHAYNYGIFNRGRITALTNVDITTTQSRTTGVNVYNYDTGVIDLISGGHMFAYSGASLFNYGGTITTVDGLTIDGKNGITNRNIRTGTWATTGYTVTDANKGIIDTIENCHIEVGQYAINNNAVINTVTASTLIAHPDTAQCDTRGNGLATASEGNVAAYTVYNSPNWWYDTNVWKRVDSSSNGYTRVDEYKEDEAYRPKIGTITDCEIYAENTTTSAGYGDYPLVNYGVIDKIGGTTNVKTYKHPDSTATITTSHYGLHNLSGGIIKSIEGTVNVSATGIGTVYNDGVFTEKINYTYGNKVGGNITHQFSTYGEPSTINSITCAGTWSCGSYYALMNSGYIKEINAPNLTLQGNTSSYNVLYNTTGGVNKTYDYTCEYTDVATAATAFHRTAMYTKNLEKGSTIGTLNGITIIGKYQVLNNQGHIGTLSNVNVSNNAASNDPTFLNGDSRYATVTEDRKNVASYPDDYPNVTISAGYATRYDRDYTYDTPTIDTIDNLTVTSNGQYAFRNAGKIGTLKNSTITGTQYALHNSATGPFTEKTSVQYYSGASLFATTKYTSEYAKHYKRDPAKIDIIDDCTITTPANTYAMFNSGHVGTIKNSTLQAGTTTAKAYALFNGGASTSVGTEREYTRDVLDNVFYVTANSGTGCTAYWSSGGETNVVTYDYDAPVIDLIGEGNTFKATTTVIANTGIINEINSGEGELTTVTGSAAKGSSIYNYSACLDARTTTTPYTAAASAKASGTAGTAVNDDTLLSGAQIGTIKNIYINANGYGILNGDGKTGKLPTIDEIGEGTEIYAHCTTANYPAVANQNYAEISKITGGLFKVTKATTNAYMNAYSAEGNADHATLISGGDFQGAANNRGNAIYRYNDTSHVTYPDGKTLSSGTESKTSANANMSGDYYYIASNYTVTFDMKDHGTAPDAQTVESGQKVTKPADPSEAGYTFRGWYSDSDCQTAFDFNTPITDDTTIYAKWEKNKYTVTWKNGDTTLETDTNVAAGTAPTYNGTAPTKAATAQYTYTFVGWSTDGTTVIDPLPAVSENVIYKAVFTQTVNNYIVTWKNADGTVLETDSNVAYGTAPAYNGATPTKEGDAQYSYTFAGWSTDGTTMIDPLPDVSGNVTYKAVFTQTVNTYTVQWVIDDSAPEADVKAAVDAVFTEDICKSVRADAYAEMGDMAPYMWSSMKFTCIMAQLNVSYGISTDGENSYLANRVLYMAGQDGITAQAVDDAWAADKDKVVSQVLNSRDLLNDEQIASLTALSGGKTILEIDNNVPYGDTPEYNGATPTKENDDQYSYTFDHWAPEIAPVTGDVTYTAVFAKQTLEPKHSITLGGEIGVNFYIPTATVKADDVANSTVKMSWGPDSGSAHGEAEFALKDLTDNNDNNKNVIFHEDNDHGLNTNNPLAKAKINGDYYQFTAYVAAKQMKDQITVQIVNGDKVVVRDPYCVADYCNEVITNENGEVSAKLGYTEEQFEKLQNLCKAMLTYGSRAQTQFSYNTENLADEGIDYTYTPTQASDFADYYSADYMSDTNDMAYYGSSLLLEAETTYSVWMRYENAGYTPPTATAKIGDKEIAIETMKVEGNYDAYYVRYNVINLPANLLTKDITVNFNGEQKTYNAKSYFYLALSQGNDTLKNTITSLYNYNQVAVDYFGE